MATSLDALNAPQSLTARRQAHLPNFELPPPPLSQFTSHQNQKYPTLSSINATQPMPASVSVGHLLTPPSNAAQDSLSPISSGLTNSNTPSAQGLPPYTPNQYWPTGNTPYGFGSGNTPQPWGQSINPLFPPRGMFSPSLGSLVRNNSNSPTAGDSLPPPPYDINLPPFQTSASMGAPPSMPTSAAQHQAMANAMAMNNQQNSIGATQPSPVSSTDTYSQKPPTSHGYGSQPSSHPGSYQGGYGGPSPVQQSPMSANAPVSRVSPPMHQSPTAQQNQQQNHFSRPPYPSYSLPAMTGPIMTNVHSPGSQMSLVGNMHTGMMPGFNSGQAASMQQMYGAHPGTQQPPPNDRPFKCDQCPQSFNRNHDLKRHKRIHLAVKPFPCNHCDKSFSRKDALKRHILVKGCGKRGAEEAGIKDEGNTKSESMSEDGESSPAVNGRA